MWHKFPDEEPPQGFTVYPVWNVMGFMRYCMWSPDTQKWYSNSAQFNYYEEYPYKIIAWYDVPEYRGE